MTTEPKDYARVKFKQLTLQERLDIATCLSRGFNLTDTAKFIDCSISTVKKEIDRNKYLKVNERFKNKCGFKLTCDSHNVCSNYQCTHLCSDCRYSKINCNTICKQFTLNPQCKLLKKHCGVCNGCHKKDTCKLNKWFYNPNDSQIKHEANISDAHKGSFITKDEANNLAMTIKSNLSKNISISVIKNKFNIKYSVQSIYNWINDGILPGVNNLNLLRKVKYKQRKKKENKEDSYNRDYLIGRYYDDFIQYTIDHPNDEVVEMDCVEGKGHSSAIMTLLFRRSNFMLAFKLKKHDSQSIVEVFDNIKNVLGVNTFKQTFKIILTDRGQEFSKPDAIEIDNKTGELLSKVFFCDSRQSQQKGKIEKNHEELRKICPKGFDFNTITLNELNIVMSHVNSYPREMFNFKAPIDLFKIYVHPSVLTLNDSKHIPIDNLNMSPSLLKK